MSESTTNYGFRFIEDGAIGTKKQWAETQSKIFQGKKNKNSKRKRRK